jgi:hypothetical protein
MSFCTTSGKSKIKFSYFCYPRQVLLCGAIRRPLDVSDFAQHFVSR